MAELQRHEQDIERYAAGGWCSDGVCDVQTVSEVNDAPVPGNDSSVSVTTLLANDTDGDCGAL